MSKNIIVSIALLFGLSQIGEAQILGSRYPTPVGTKPPFVSKGNASAQMPAGSVVYRLTGFRHDNWNPDKKVWEYSDSSTYTYDANALRTSEHDYDYSLTWKDSVKHFYTSDANGNQTSDITQLWIPWQNNWRNSQKSTWVWNSQNLDIEDMAQSWDTLKNSWVTSDHRIWAYDSNQRLTQMTEEFVISGILTKSRSQSSYFKDSTIGLKQNFDGSQWVNYTLKHTYLDANGFDTLDIGQLWDVTNAMWLNNNKNVNLSNSYGDLIRDSSFVWDTKKNRWANYLIDSFGYDADRRIVLNEYIWWNPTLSKWDTYDLLKYSYNSDGNEITYEQLTGDGKSWNPYSLDTLIYDDHKNLVLDLTQLYYGSPDFRRYYYYNSFDVNSAVPSEKNELAATVFPNPLHTENLRVSFSAPTEGKVSLRIYDMQGKLLSSEIRNVIKDKNEIQISMPSVSAGSYFIQITNQNEKVSILKFTKE